VEIMERRIFIQGAVSLAAGAMLSACAYGPGPGGGGPPPWAPAHGYRRKHPGGATLVYDTGLGVYVVAGMPGYYYIDDRFYRAVNGAWQVAVAIDGPWQPAEAGGVPPGLARRNGGGGPPGQSGRGGPPGQKKQK
jgi:hypothetical protein